MDGLVYLFEYSLQPAYHLGPISFATPHSRYGLLYSNIKNEKLNRKRVPLHTRLVDILDTRLIPVGKGKEAIILSKYN
jgi:hypothetical protein